MPNAGSLKRSDQYQTLTKTLAYLDEKLKIDKGLNPQYIIFMTYTDLPQLKGSFLEIQKTFQCKKLFIPM